MSTEGFDPPKIKMRPADEPPVELERRDRVNRAEIAVKGMFDERMREVDVGTSFEYPRN